MPVGERDERRRRLPARPPASAPATASASSSSGLRRPAVAAPSAMSFRRGIVNDLRERRLWPVAAALVLAIVAVPVLLARSAKTAPPTPATAAGLPTALPTQGPTSASARRRTSRGCTGHSRATRSSSRAASTRTVGHRPGHDDHARTGSTARDRLDPARPARRPRPRQPVRRPQEAAHVRRRWDHADDPEPTTDDDRTRRPSPRPPGLTATQAYTSPSRSRTRAEASTRSTRSQRLSVLPSEQQPLLIELGVLKGGHRVLFVVQPGTVVSGPGTCTPGPIDCEILSLGENQTESLGRQAPTGVVAVALFAVTAIAPPGTRRAPRPTRPARRSPQSVASCSTARRQRALAVPVRPERRRRRRPAQSHGWR